MCSISQGVFTLAVSIMTLSIASMCVIMVVDMYKQCKKEWRRDTKQGFPQVKVCKEYKAGWHYSTRHLKNDT